MFARTGLFANNRSTLQAQYWLMPKNRHTIFFYRNALAISSMMHYHLQDLIKSEHLQITFLHISLSKKFLIPWSGQLLFSFIYWHFYFKVWCLIIVIFLWMKWDLLSWPVNYIIAFVLFFPHFHAHVYFHAHSVFQLCRNWWNLGWR